MKLLIKNGNILDPASNLEIKGDILIENGVIASIDKKIANNKGEVQVFDAAGLLVVPGLIDLHCHLREPGYEYKETIATGTLSAAAGGFTSVTAMANTNPVNDNRAVTEFIIEKGYKDGFVNLFPVAAVSKGMEGEVLTEMNDLKDAGAVGFSDDGKCVANSEVMRKALEYSTGICSFIMSHCEDAGLSSGGQINEGWISTKLGLKGIPASSENIMIARDIFLAKESKGRLHITHLTTKKGVELIRRAKEEGVNVTADTCPHYFTLTDEACEGYNTFAKVKPPLKGEEDRIAVIEGLKDGTIDAISTDHAPHNHDEKNCEFNEALFGMIGFETALSLSLRLYEEGSLSLKDLIGKFTVNPAGIIRTNRGRLANGLPADITLIDLKKEWVVEAENLKSKSKNTPFNGWKMKGKARAVVVNGKLMEF